MWRSILAVFLAPVLTVAQTAQNQPVPTVPEPCNSGTYVKKVPSLPKYDHYTYHDRIRRGRDEDAVIQVLVAGDVTTMKSDAHGIVPLSLELQPLDGLTVKKLQYPKVVEKKVKFQSEPIKVARSTDIHFKIRADQNAALGSRVLKGKLTYQLIPWDGSGPGAVQTIDVEIRLTIVEHDAKVQRAAYPYQHTPAALIVAMIVFAPLLVAAAVVSSPFWITCWASGSCMD